MAEPKGRWCRPAVAVPLLAALAVLLNAPYFQAGFAADDVLLLELLRQDEHPFGRWLGLWAGWEVPALTSLWWIDADVSGGFWRPLPSLVFEGSVQLFGEVAWPLHALQLGLHAFVGVAVYLLVRGLSRGPRELEALLAGALFVLCEDHSMGVGWIATMTDMMAVALLLGALLAHRAFLAQRRAGLLAGSLGLAVLSFGCKESAAVAPLLLLLASFFFPRGVEGEPCSWAARAGALARDRLAWMPQAVLLVMFVLGYLALPIEPVRNLLYVDPIQQPGAYLRQAAVQLPIMALGALSPAPPSLAMFYPGLVAWLALCGALLLVVYGWLLRPVLRRPMAAFGCLLFFVALAPQLATVASERGLYLPFVGAAMLLCIPLASLPLLRGPARGLRLRLAGWWALLAVLVPGALLTAYYPWSIAPSLRSAERHARTALPYLEPMPEQVLVLSCAGMGDTLYLGDMLAHALGVRPELYILNASNTVVSVQRLDQRSLRLRVDRPGWLSNPFARVVRTGPWLAVGRVYDRAPFRVTLEELTVDGKDLLAARFDLPRPLSDPGLLWLYWTPQGFRPIDLGALPLGEERVLTDSTALWASFY